MNIYLYIITMALVTYLIRVLPLTVFKKKITNKFLLSFLYYVPYSCLTAMTIPAIFSSTSSLISAVCGFITAVVLGYFNKGLVSVALSASATVFLVETLLSLI